MFDASRNGKNTDDNSDHLTFLARWLSHPWRIGAVAPSGRSLARLMVSELSRRSAPVFELGPGTGVFTHALLEKSIPAREITLVEFDQDFAALLQKRFPDTRVLCGDAARLSKHELSAQCGLGAVISGLPLLSMPIRKVAMILIASFRLLRPGASFYQFTYGSRCPIPRALLERLGLKASRVGRTYRNIPPATVYRISR